MYVLYAGMTFVGMLMIILKLRYGWKVNSVISQEI